MIQKKLILLIIFIYVGVILLCNPAFAQTQPPPLPTGRQATPPLLKGGEGEVILEIRERLIRIEEGQKALNQRIDELDKRLSGRIDELDKRLGGRIDGLEKRMDYLVNLIYVVLAGMFTLVGFVLWDRRSALAPAIRRTRDIEEREEKLERAIKEFALKNPDMKEILKSLGLL
ncbi:MAG: hypothetical protein FJ130_06005 [Deltaproteobacteria bacterium]|nr:hypothetical protein [Deltaproteobacteria bacterium]